MISRRDYLKLALASGTALTLNPSLLWAQDRQLPLITRAIPSSGQRLPVVGLGSSATFSSTARSEDHAALREVFQALVAHQGQVFDTAPGYGASEEVAGSIVQELGLQQQVFWATKLNVAGRGGGQADRAAAERQLQTSFDRIRKNPVDLVQVHNLGDVPTQLGLLKEQKAAGRIRYIGVTSTFKNQYAELERIMRNEPLDFIGVDYAIDNLDVEERILPLAQDRGIGVLVYAPFGRTRLWDKVRGHEVPDWAHEFDAHSWGQFFLKFVLSNPVVTAATPATSRARNMIDNLGAALGGLPDNTQRQRMIQHLNSLG